MRGPRRIRILNNGLQEVVGMNLRAKGKRRGPGEPSREPKKQMTVTNAELGTAVTFLLNVRDGRISQRQLREIRQQMAPPGARSATGEPFGILGEFPWLFEPPEYPGILYHVVRRGERSSQRWGPSEYCLVPWEAGEPSAASALAGQTAAERETPRAEAAA